MQGAAIGAECGGVKWLLFGESLTSLDKGEPAVLRRLLQGAEQRS